MNVTDKHITRQCKHDEGGGDQSYWMQQQPIEEDNKTHCQNETQGYSPRHWHIHVDFASAVAAVG